MPDTDPEAIRAEMASRHVYDQCGALSPRVACTRHFHPEDPDGHEWPGIANAQERANWNASPGTVTEQSEGAPSKAADESTARTLDLEHIRQQVPIVYAGGYGNSTGHSVREHHLAGLDAVAEWVATLTRARRG